MTKGRKSSKGEGKFKTTVREGEKEARKRKEEGEAGDKREEEKKSVKKRKIKSNQRDKPDQIVEKHVLVCLFQNYSSLSQS